MGGEEREQTEEKGGGRAVVRGRREGTKGMNVKRPGKGGEWETERMGRAPFLPNPPLASLLPPSSPP